MKVPSQQIPDYAQAYHYAWEAHLHRVEADIKKSGKEFTYEDRRRTVDDFIRREPARASNVVRCLVCQAAFARAKDTGEDVWAIPEIARKTLESYGFFSRRGQITRLPASKRT